MIFNQLQSFRQTLYNRLGNARDALFDLMDAVLVSASIVSFVSLSQSPVFRRRWPNTYTALEESCLAPAQVLKLVVPYIPTATQPILAEDVSRWDRPAANSLKNRSLSGRVSQAVTAGHSSSILAWILEDRRSASSVEPWQLGAACHFIQQP
jgi:hypothetical protein